MNSLIIKQLLSHKMYDKCPHTELCALGLSCPAGTTRPSCGRTQECWLNYFMASTSRKYISQSISLELPWPVTVNRYLNGGYRESTESKQYKSTVAALVAKAVSFVRINGKLETPFTGCVRVIGLACPPDRRTRDMNNIYKVLYDALVYAKLIEDDSLIKYDEWSFCDNYIGKVAITVEELRETPVMAKWSELAEKQRQEHGEAITDLMDSALLAEELGDIDEIDTCKPPNSDSEANA